MYEEEQPYMSSDMTKVFSYHSKPTSPEPKTTSHKNRQKQKNTSGLELRTEDFGSKPMSPPTIRTDLFSNHKSIKNKAKRSRRGQLNLSMGNQSNNLNFSKSGSKNNFFLYK